MMPAWDDAFGSVSRIARAAARLGVPSPLWAFSAKYGARPLRVWIFVGGEHRSWSLSELRKALDEEEAMTYQEIIERLEAIGAALRSEVEEAEDSRLFTSRFVGCIETVLALIADLKAVEVIREGAGFLQRDGTGLFVLELEEYIEGDFEDDCPVHVTITRREP